MGQIINTIINNDLLFYGIIIFLIVGLILLFSYLHHKKVMSLIENEIEYTKIDSKTYANSDSKNYGLDDVSSSIEEKIEKLDGKLAIEKIMNEEKNTKSMSFNEYEEKNAEIEMNSKEENISFDETNENATIKTYEPIKKESVLESEKEDVSINEKKSELELMLEKMQRDLEEQKDKDAVAIFEQEQEEKSIISYKELLEKKNEIIENKEIFNDERFENEPFVIENESLSNVYNNLVDNVNNQMSIDSVKEEYGNSNSDSKNAIIKDFISPVFGRREAKLDYPKVPNFKEMMLKNENQNEYSIETTMNLEPLSNQIKKDDAFLNALKEFRKNLE